MTKNKITRKQAEAVRDEVAKFLGVEPDALFLADHHHEGLQPGSWSLALEGSYDWPSLFTEAQFGSRTVSDAVFIEPLSGWGLGIHPA